MSISISHKHGVIIEVPEHLDLLQVFQNWCPRDDEDVHVLDVDSSLDTFKKDVIWVKLRKYCAFADHEPEDCDTRLPIVLEGHIYPIVRWDEWLEKYAR